MCEIKELLTNIVLEKGITDIILGYKYDLELQECSYCNELFDKDDFMNEHQVCNECFNENYRQCNECNHLDDIEQFCDCDRCEEVCCFDCIVCVKYYRLIDDETDIDYGKVVSFEESNDCISCCERIHNQCQGCEMWYNNNVEDKYYSEDTCRDCNIELEEEEKEYN